MNAVILKNFGGPRSSNEVRAFLASIYKAHLPCFLRPFADFFAKRRLPRSIEMYKKIGGSSPVVSATEGLALALREKMPEHSVFFGMEHGEPFYDEVFASAVSAGCEKMVSLPLYPLDDDEFCFDPEFIAVMSDLVRTAVATLKDVPITNVHLIFSAHSLPFFAGSGHCAKYQKRVETLASKIASAFVGATCHVAYQSQMNKLLWLGPSTGDVIKSVARSSTCSRKLACVIVPLGFICENLETLFEIDQCYLPDAARLFKGGAVRARTPAEMPALVDLLAKLAKRRLQV